MKPGAMDIMSYQQCESFLVVQALQSSIAILKVIWKAGRLFKLEKICLVMTTTSVHVQRRCQDWNVSLLKPLYLDTRTQFQGRREQYWSLCSGGKIHKWSQAGVIEELGDAKAVLKNCRKGGKGILQPYRTAREKAKRDNTVKKDTP